MAGEKKKEILPDLHIRLRDIFLTSEPESCFIRYMLYQYCNHGSDGTIKEKSVAISRTYRAIRLRLYQRQSALSTLSKVGLMTWLISGARR
jgi:hypothetical protein